MNDFLKFIDELASHFPVHVSINYSKICDWEIYVYKKGCADDYPESPRIDDDAILCHVQSCDVELAFAMAHVKVKEWLCEYNGGY